jgi:predicted nucleic acid-binding Zn ribbon protein
VPDEPTPRSPEPAGTEPAGSEPGRHDASGHDPTGTELARQLAGRIKGRRRRQAKRATEARVPRTSGAHPDARDPRLLDAAVRGMVEDQGWQADVRVHGVFARWDQIVGPEVAAHCVPQTCRDGELTIRTDSTAWANQVRLLAADLVRRLNEELGHDTIAKVIVEAPAAPSWRKGFRTVRGARGPRDTYG